MISDIHHVSINVDDLAAAEHFYVDVLGLVPIPRPDFGVPGAWLAAGERQVHLIEVDAVPADMGQHFAFRVSDLDAVVAHLAANDIAVEDVFETPVGRQVALQDPCGNRVELNQPK